MFLRVNKILYIDLSSYKLTRSIFAPKEAKKRKRSKIRRSTNDERVLGDRSYPLNSRLGFDTARAENVAPLG